MTTAMTMQDDTCTGYLVACRGSETGQYILTHAPATHPDFRDAAAEARRLAKAFPGETFVVLGERLSITIKDPAK
jgi:hypothetical protein